MIILSKILSWIFVKLLQNPRVRYKSDLYKYFTSLYILIAKAFAGVGVSAVIENNSRIKQITW